MPRYSFLALTIAALAAGLALAQTPVSAPPPAVEMGLASWYGGSFDGQRAASGETFHQTELTAAHRTLAFGTKVRVRRLDSGQSVVVRINDRGPYVASRVIDLSYAAARGLGMTHPGLAPVALEVLEAPVTSVPALFGVKAGTFRDPANAQRTLALMQQKFGAAKIVPVRRDDEELFAVIVGEAPTQADAETLAGKIKAMNKAYASAFVVRVDPAPPLIAAARAE